MESASSVTSHYNYAWPSILHGLALWLAHVDFVEEIEDEKVVKERENKLHLVMGESMSCKSRYCACAVELEVPSKVLIFCLA